MRLSSRQTALIGLAALGVYILACRPAFSPDGSKILIGTLGTDTTPSRVLLYDRRKESWSSVLEVDVPGGADRMPPIAFWSQDGRRAIALFAGEADDALWLFTMPVQRPGTVRLSVLAEIQDAHESLILPPALVGDTLLFGAKSLTRVDLQTGRWSESPFPGAGSEASALEELYVTGAAGKAYYGLREGDQIQFGRLELDPLRRVPILTLPEEEGDLPFMVQEPRGSRVAVLRGMGQDSEAWVLQIYAGEQVTRTIRSAEAKPGLALGLILWSADGKTLFAPGFRAVPGQDDRSVVLACEIAVDTGEIRETALFEAKSDDALSLSCQLAASPDNRVLAAFGPFPWESGATERPALHLVNRAARGRTVKQIPIPEVVR